MKGGEIIINLPLNTKLCSSLYAKTFGGTRFYKPMLDKLGVTYPQYLVLSTLWEQGSLTISLIADALSLESSMISPLVNRLETAGFATRVRTPTYASLVLSLITTK